MLRVRMELIMKINYPTALLGSFARLTPTTGVRDATTDALQPTRT